jgi:hypothetical protein
MDGNGEVSLQGSSSPMLPVIANLLAEAVRNTYDARLAAVASGAPLLLGRMLEASEQAVSSDGAELQRCCCWALEAILQDCPDAQVRCPSRLPSTAPPLQVERLHGSMDEKPLVYISLSYISLSYMSFLCIYSLTQGVIRRALARVLQAFCVSRLANWGLPKEGCVAACLAK